MTSHNTQNTTITQQMSVLGGGAGCWYPSPSATQLPPTAPLRHKRQSTPSHQPLSVHHVMHLGAPSPHTPHTPLQTQTHHQPLSPKAPNGPHMGPHLNHHNPHMPSNVHMTTSAQGALLASHPQELTNGGMTTSLHCMPALHQQQQHILQQQQQNQLHNTSTSITSSSQSQLSSSTSAVVSGVQASSGVAPPDISSIQQGIPQPLRGNKPPAADLRSSNNMPWHHGKITRDRAEQLLHPRSDGLFLVRESTNFPGDQTLCVCFQGRVEHYRIKCTPQATLTIDDEEFFPTLPELIDHYLQDADGLCTQLVKCLPKRQQPIMTTSNQPALQPSNQQPPPTTQQQTQQQQQVPNQQSQLLQQQKSALQQQQQLIQAQQMLPQQGQMLQGQMLHQQGQMLHQQQQQQQQQGQMLHQPGQLIGQSQLHQGQIQMQQPPPQNQQQTGNEHNLPPCLAPQAFVDAGWMIAERDLEIRENIGKGEFGDVMLGILNGQRVAVKMLKDSEAASKFLAEASLMTSLKHENLVKLLGLVFNKQHICLVTEYMSKGSLVDYLRSRGRLHVTKRDQIMFAFDTCSGMEYLEMRRVVHRDLAARNVLVSDTGRAKVADFGLAREEGGPDAAAKLPIKWTAPEALKHNKFSNKSDMWSFGILLWEIYSFGRVPYPRIPLADVVKHVEKGYKMEAPEGCPPELYELMRQAWDLNPDTRPTFSQAKSKLAILKANTPVTAVPAAP